MSSAGTSEAAGTGHVRHADDAYVTEPRVVDALLRGVEEAFEPGSIPRGEQGAGCGETGEGGSTFGRPVLPVHPWANYSVIDAGAGEGSILGTIRARGLTRSKGIEFRDDLAQKCLERGPCVQASFYDVVRASLSSRSDEPLLSSPPPSPPPPLPGALERPNLIVMNPPYLSAMEFVEAALRWVRTTKVKETGEKKYATVAALLRLPWLASKGRVAFHQKNPSAVWVLPDRPSFTGDNKVDSTDYAWFLWSKDPRIAPGTWKILDMAPKPPKIRLPRLKPPVDDPEVELLTLKELQDRAKREDEDRLRLGPKFEGASS